MEAEDPPDFYRFGVFEVDAGSGRLLRRGSLVKIQEQPLRLLLVLLARSGEVVTREELRQQLWPSDTYVDFEGSVNVALKRLRRALGDSADNPTFIETVPKRGYRFIAPVERASRLQVAGGRGIPAPVPVASSEDETLPSVEGSNALRGGARSLAAAARPAPSEPVLLPFPVPRPAARRYHVWQIFVAALALLAAGAGAYELWPGRPPRVLRRVQLTHFGRAEAGAGMATDGARIFFSEVKGGHYSVDQVPVGGGDPAPFPLPFPNSEVFDISPDRTELLVASFSGLGPDEALWVVPATGGAPRRLGDSLGSSGAWSPDGQTIAYTHGPDLYTISRDGNTARRIVNMPGTETGRVRWAPSGRSLRFTITGGNSVPEWEVAADGSGLHVVPLNPQRQPENGRGYGAWTPDGRYFLFQALAGGVGSIWATREFRGFFRRFNQKPVEIYAGPSVFYGPLPSADGKRIFLIEEQGRSELVRYDSRGGQFVPHLGGIPADRLDYSKDGRQMVYTLGADDELWSSKADGSDAHRLTFLPMIAFRARFSPDGRSIAFDAAGTGLPSGVYLTAPEGGAKPELALAQAAGGLVGWSSDGQSLMVWRPTNAGDSFAMFALSLKTRALTLLPGSEGIHHGWLSPDGLRIAALSIGDKSVVLYDLQTHRQTEVAKGAAVVNPYWSHDGRTVFFQDIFQGADQPIYRVRVDNRQVERVTNFAQPLAADVTTYRLTGITPDDQLLSLLIRTNSDLYALDVDFP